MLPNPYVKQQLIIRPSRLFHVQGFAFAMYYYFGLFYTMTQQSTKNGLRETYILYNLLQLQKLTCLETASKNPIAHLFTYYIGAAKYHD